MIAKAIYILAKFNVRNLESKIKQWPITFMHNMTFIFPKAINIWLHNIYERHKSTNSKTINSINKKENIVMVKNKIDQWQKIIIIIIFIEEGWFNFKFIEYYPRDSFFHPIVEQGNNDNVQWHQIQLQKALISWFIR